MDANIAADLTFIHTNYFCNSKVSSIVQLVCAGLRVMALSNVSIVPFWTNISAFKVDKNSMNPWMRCRRIWKNICINTITNVRTKGAI